MGEACTIVLRGATKQILDEAERSLHDALCVLSQTVRETKTVFGGGKWLLCVRNESGGRHWRVVHSLATSLSAYLCFISPSSLHHLYVFITSSLLHHGLTGASEMLMSNAVSQLAALTPGKEAIAMEAYSKALRMVGVIL